MYMVVLHSTTYVCTYDVCTASTYSMYVRADGKDAFGESPRDRGNNAAIWAGNTYVSTLRSTCSVQCTIHMYSRATCPYKYIYIVLSQILAIYLLYT